MSSHFNAYINKVITNSENGIPNMLKNICQPATITVHAYDRQT